MNLNLKQATSNKFLNLINRAPKPLIQMTQQQPSHLRMTVYRWITFLNSEIFILCQKVKLERNMVKTVGLQKS